MAAQLDMRTTNSKTTGFGGDKAKDYKGSKFACGQVWQSSASCWHWRMTAFNSFI
jgi:hypothetical protein